MRRQALAVICGVVGLIGLAGCGGSGGSAVDTTSAKALCPHARSAERHYTSVAEAMGLQLTNKSLEEPTRKAAEALLLRVRQLERVSTEKQGRQLSQLAAGLTKQTMMFKALERNNHEEAVKYGNSIMGTIGQGLIDLHAICP